MSRNLDTQGFEWLGQPLKGAFLNVQLIPEQMFRYEQFGSEASNGNGTESQRFFRNNQPYTEIKKWWELGSVELAEAAIENEIRRVADPVK